MAVKAATARTAHAPGVLVAMNTLVKTGPTVLLKYELRSQMPRSCATATLSSATERELPADRMNCPMGAAQPYRVGHL